MTAPSRIVQWLAIRASAPICAPWMVHMCAMVAPGPTSTGIPGGACSTEPSWTLAPSRITTGA